MCVFFSFHRPRATELYSLSLPGARPIPLPPALLGPVVGLSPPVSRGGQGALSPPQALPHQGVGGPVRAHLEEGGEGRGGGVSDLVYVLLYVL